VEAIAEPVQCHGSIFDHCRGQKLDTLVALERARRPLDDTALAGQALQLGVVKHAREVPCDFCGSVRQRSLQRHGDVPCYARDVRRSFHRMDGPMIYNTCEKSET
jgi:hypothetical protein